MSTMTKYCTIRTESSIVTGTNLPHASLRSHEELVAGIGKNRVDSTSSYSSRRRAFNRGSAIIYCNQDILTCFVTLTYRVQHSDYQMIINDLKNVFTRNHIQYIAVVEKHKTGFYHVHAITSDLGESVVSLRKGKHSLASWKKGFSDVKFISGVDEKFKIGLYIFKYMNKAEKIGGRYFLKSRGLTVQRFSYPPGAFPTEIIHDKPIDYKQYNIYNHGNSYLTVERMFYK